VTSNSPCAPAPLAWTTLRVSHCDDKGYIPLRDTFTIKVREQVNQMEVLKEKWARGAYSLRSVGVEDWSAV